MKVRTAIAVVASFSIYFLPLFDPPGITCWGCYLLDLLNARYGPLDPLKLGAFLLVTAVWQSGAGLVVWYFLGHPGWLRGLALPAAAIALTIASQYVSHAFLIIAPMLDRETAAEKADLPVECAVPGAFLAPTRSVPGNSLGASGEALLFGERQHALLKMPGCAVRALAIPIEAISIPPPVVLPGGIALYRNARDSQWWLASDPERDPVKLEAPPKSGSPMLSSDGRWIAWPLQEFGSKPSVSIRKLDGAEEIVFPVAIRWPLPLEVLQLDMQNRTITLFDHEEGFRSLNLDGATRWGPVYPNPHHLSGTILLAEGIGWMVPHVARGEDAWFFPWGPSGARINLGLRRGQGLQSVSIDPAGTFIGFSAEESERTTVGVIRIRDGEVVFRRYLPRMNHAPVTFLGDRFFAYSEPRRVQVLRLPQTPASAPSVICRFRGKGN